MALGEEMQKGKVGVRTNSQAELRQVIFRVGAQGEPPEATGLPTPISEPKVSHTKNPQKM